MGRTALLLCGLLTPACLVLAQGPWLSAYQTVCEGWEDEAVAAHFLDFCTSSDAQGITPDEVLGFRAAAELIHASHGWNPIAQWNTFVTWRDTLEAAIERSPDSPTLRLIRLGVQDNAPRFLGYFREIEGDQARCERALSDGVWRAHLTFEQFVKETLND